jgi:transcriptional regulator with XRE-family HTH domain
VRRARTRSLPIDASGRVLSFGRQLLARAIEREGLTQAEAARAVDASQAAIARLLGGARPSDSYTLRRALRDRFGVPLDAWETPAQPENVLGLDDAQIAEIIARVDAQIARGATSRRAGRAA